MVRTLHGIYILHEQEKIFPYDQRVREVKTSIFTPPPLNRDMGRAVIIFYKRLTAMLNEKRDSHTANDGVIMFPLKICPP